MLNPYQRQFRYPQNFQRQMNMFNNNMPQPKNNESTIRFEPFNKNDLEKIKSSVQSKLDTTKITNSIQNEHNGSIFYKYLLSIIKNENAATVLKKIENNCIYRKNILNEIYKMNTQNKFEVQNAQINKISEPSNGINFAIGQETQSAQDLLIIINEASDADTLKKLNFIFNQKLLDINYLNWLRQNI